MTALDEKTNALLSWQALKQHIGGQIRIEHQVIKSMADHPVTVARCQAKIEALRNVAAAMETMEATNGDDPPEYDADGEAERIGETFDQAADDYARIERGEM